MLADDRHLKKFMPLPTSAEVLIHKSSRKNTEKSEKCLGGKKRSRLGNAVTSKDIQMEMSSEEMVLRQMES